MECGIVGHERIAKPGAGERRTVLELAKRDYNFEAWKIFSDLCEEGVKLSYLTGVETRIH